MTAQTSFNTDVARDTFTTDLYLGTGQDFGSFDYYVGAGYTDGGRSRSGNGNPVLSSDFEAIDLVGSFGLDLGQARISVTPKRPSPASALTTGPTPPISPRASPRAMPRARTSTFISIPALPA